MPLAGGIMQYGYQCGMLWGGALAAGAQAFRQFGPGAEAETKAILAASRLIESFRDRNKEINCFEITEIEWKPSSNRDLLGQVVKFFLKGGPIRCFRMAAKCAPVVHDAITTTFSENHYETPSPPVSCASVLAQKMGVSQMHVVMAAGFAGGIGLSGGGCGALGAAIWIIGMNSIKGGSEKFDFAPPGASEMVDQFVECTDYEFECIKIVGRKFENVVDHAEYLNAGGCSKIIEVLAGSQSQ